MIGSSNHSTLLRTRIGSWLRALATRDVFPVFSAKVRRLLYNPLSVLLLTGLVALLSGLFLHSHGLLLFGGIMGVMVLGIAWPWLSLRGLRGSIAFERSRASEGERVEVCLTIRNRMPWTAWGLAVRGGFSYPIRLSLPDTLPHKEGERKNGQHPPERVSDTAEADELTPVVSIARAPRQRITRCRWSFVPPCRGVYPLRAPCLTTGFPFGLWESKRRLVGETPFLVWPRTFPVGPVPVVGGDEQVEGNVSRSKVGSNGDVLGVRPYRRGDTPRRIHWGQSARHDRLIVCELESNARPRILLVLDSDPRVHAGHGPDSSREWAIRIVASLAAGWLAAGAQVGSVWNGQVLPAASGQSQLHRLLDSLTRLSDVPGPTLADTLSGPACHGCTSGLQVIVTTDVALAQVGRAWPADDRRRWVVLQASAFTNPPPTCCATPTRLPVRPWLWIDAPQRVPALLRAGWKEAQHGS